MGPAWEREAVGRRKHRPQLQAPWVARRGGRMAASKQRLSAGQLGWQELLVRRAQQRAYSRFALCPSSGNRDPARSWLPDLAGRGRAAKPLVRAHKEPDQGGEQSGFRELQRQSPRRDRGDGPPPTLDG